MQESLTLSEAAEWTGKSISTVQSFCEQGLASKKVGRNRVIALRALVQWLAARESEPGSQRERLARAQAEKHELENARKRGELIYADQVAEVLSTLAADVAARMDAISGRLAGELAGLSDPAVIRGRLRDEHRSVRGAFADAVAKLADALGSSEDDGEDSIPAAEPDPEPVGGLKPRPAARKRRAGAVSQQ